MDSDLSLEFLRVVEQAAIACAHTMGQGDRHKSDQVAVEAMRRVMDSVPIHGTIVIGEGERDEAPMLYIGEKVGMGVRFTEVDIAVDPLEGTNLCATGAPNAIAVLAASTLNPAKVMGLTDSLGLVAPGFVADLLLLDRDPTVDISAVRSLYSMVRNGRLLTRQDLDRLREEGRR
jgi:hypothetical protein